MLIAMTGYIGDVAIVLDRDLSSRAQSASWEVHGSRPKSTNGTVSFSICLEPSKFVEELEGLGYGSAQANISPTLIQSVEITLPSLPQQRAIAHVLGTLDDKIELNRRMNETLEGEMARALFKSWFVDFDPVRAKMEGRWHRSESLPGLPADLYDLFPNRIGTL